jgi:hypothetical protein
MRTCSSRPPEAAQEGGRDAVCERSSRRSWNPARRALYRSTAAAPRALTPRTFWRLGRCWKSARNMTPADTCSYPCATAPRWTRPARRRVRWHAGTADPRRQVPDGPRGGGVVTARRVRHRRAPPGLPQSAAHGHGATRPGHSSHSAFLGRHGTCISGSASSVMRHTHTTGNVSHGSRTTSGRAVSIFSWRWWRYNLIKSERWRYTSSHNHERQSVAAIKIEADGSGLWG